MKLYVVVYTKYFEAEGLENYVSIFNTYEEAAKDLNRTYQRILNTSDYSEEDIEWNTFEDDCYSFCGYGNYGTFERYEGRIIEKEVKFYDN